MGLSSFKKRIKPTHERAATCRESITARTSWHYSNQRNKQPSQQISKHLPPCHTCPFNICLLLILSVWLLSQVLTISSVLVAVGWRNNDLRDWGGKYPLWRSFRVSPLLVLFMTERMLIWRQCFCDINQYLFLVPIMCQALFLPGTPHFQTVTLKIPMPSPRLLRGRRLFKTSSNCWVRTVSSEWESLPSFPSIL